MNEMALAHILLKHNLLLRQAYKKKTKKKNYVNTKTHYHSKRQLWMWWDYTDGATASRKTVMQTIVRHFIVAMRSAPPCTTLRQWWLLRQINISYMAVPAEWRQYNLCTVRRNCINNWNTQKRTCKSSSGYSKTNMLSLKQRITNAKSPNARGVRKLPKANSTGHAHNSQQILTLAWCSHSQVSVTHRYWCAA